MQPEIDSSRSYGFLRFLKRCDRRGIPSSQLEKKVGKHSFEGSLQRLKKDDRFRFSGFLFFRPVFDDTRLIMENTIASGSFGTVSRANYLGETVAVKTIFEKNCHPDDLQRLCDAVMIEASIIEQKKSRYIVQLYHFNREKRHIVMEYCQNGSLYDVICRDDLHHIVHNWKQRLNWMIHVALGMNVLHNQDPTVLHRDLKSSNIFLDEHWTAKVGDFGLSKPLRVGRGLIGMSSIQQLNMIWQAPEVRRDNKFSTKSDVFSFAVVMHEMLLLKGPYGFDSSCDHIHIRINNYIDSGGGLEVPEDRSELPGRWNPRLEEYIALMYRCCAENPDDRPEFGEISRSLKDIRKKYINAINLEDNNPRICTTDKSAKWTVAITVVVLLAALIILLVKHWVREEVEKDHFLHAVSIIIFLALLTLVVLALFWKWNSIKTSLKHVCEQSMGNTLSSDIDKWNELQQIKVETDRPPMPSPFQIPPGVSSIFSKDECNHAQLKIPSPEQWRRLREGFISELRGEAQDSQEDLFQFCSKNRHDQLTLSQWQEFGKILDGNPQISGTKTWKQYIELVSIPAQSIEQVIQTPHRYMCGEPGPSVLQTGAHSPLLLSSSGDIPTSSSDSVVVSSSLAATPTLERSVSLGVPAHESMMHRSLPLDTVHEVSFRFEKSDQEVNHSSSAL